MKYTGKDCQMNELHRLYGSITNYIRSDRDGICEAIRNNPVYDREIVLNHGFEIRERHRNYTVEQLADEVIEFCGSLLERLSEWRRDEYRTAEILDNIFWAFPVKGDTTLGGHRENSEVFVDMLRATGLTNEGIVERVNSLPGCCASVVEKVLFQHIHIDYTFRYAYNHLRVCRNCRGGIGDYELLEVDEDKLKALIFLEEAKHEKQSVFPQSLSFGLRLEYRKREKEFIEKLYSLLNEQTIPYISDVTDRDTFRAVMLTRDHTKEDKRIHWMCDTKDVYYITKKLMDYFNGLTFDHFGKLCVSKRGFVLKNLVANKTDYPRHKTGVDNVFSEFNAFLLKS